MIEKIKFGAAVLAGAVVFYGSIWLMLAIGVMAGA
jgi:hypothetical protein